MLPSAGNQINVACDVWTGRPRAIRMGSGEQPVLAIERIRDESSAYRAHRGPRTIFVVRTADARMQLSFEHRPRRWVLDGMEVRQDPLRRAA